MSFISVHADGPPPDVPRNGVLEIVFEAAREVPFPFLAEGAVAFRSPSGTRYRADLFHDGGQAWGTRCHAREDGEWTWTSEAPDLPGIDGLEGRFHVVPSALPGALVPHPANPCALATEDGGAFLPVGDTAYALFAASDQRFGDWVDDSRAFGVNFLRTSVFGTLRTWDSHFAPNAMPALGPLRRQDALLRRLLDEWPAAHLEFILLPEHPERIWPGLPAESRQSFLRQAVARWAAFPQIVWMAFNDFDCAPGSPGEAVAREVLGFLRDRDPWGRLRTTGTMRGLPPPLADDSLVTFLHLETLNALDGSPALNYARCRKFVWCGEDRYERYRPPNHPDYFFRRLFWAWSLSGGSACYGGVWEEPRPYRAEGLHGLDGVRHIPAFLDARHLDLALFRPCDGRAKTQPEVRSLDRVKAAARPDGSEWLFYHPNSVGEGESVHCADTAASFTADLRDASGPFLAEWLRCRDGLVAAGPDVEGGDNIRFTAPWPGEDVVLHLCRAIATEHP